MILELRVRLNEDDVAELEALAVAGCDEFPLGRVVHRVLEAYERRGLSEVAS